MDRITRIRNRLISTRRVIFSHAGYRVMICRIPNYSPPEFSVEIFDDRLKIASVKIIGTHTNAVINAMLVAEIDTLKLLPMRVDKTSSGFPLRLREINNRRLPGYWRKHRQVYPNLCTAIREWFNDKLPKSLKTEIRSLSDDELNDTWRR